MGIAILSDVVFQLAEAAYVAAHFFKITLIFRPMTTDIAEADGWKTVFLIARGTINSAV